MTDGAIRRDSSPEKAPITMAIDTAGMSRSELAKHVSEGEDKHRRALATQRGKREAAKDVLGTMGAGLAGAAAGGALAGLGIDDAVKVGSIGTSGIVGLGAAAFALYKGVSGGDAATANMWGSFALGMTAPMFHGLVKGAVENFREGSSTAESV